MATGFAKRLLRLVFRPAPEAAPAAAADEAQVAAGHDHPRFKFASPGAKLAQLGELELRRLLFEDKLDVGPDSETPDILAWLLHFDHQDIAAQLLREGRADPWPAWETCVRQVLRGDRWLLQHARIDPNRPLMFTPAPFPGRLGQGRPRDDIPVAPILFLRTYFAQYVSIARRLGPEHPCRPLWEAKRDHSTEPPPTEVVDDLLRLRRVDHPLDHDRRKHEQEELIELQAYFPGDYEVSRETQRLFETNEFRCKSDWVERVVRADRIRTLLEFGASPQPPLRSTNSVTAHPPLVTAFNHTILRLLLEAKADPDGYDGGNFEVPIVARMNQPAVVRLLLEAGANPNARAERGPEHVQGLSVFHNAMQHCPSAEYCLLLLEFGAELAEEVDGLMRTPLTLQARNFLGRTCLVSFLLKFPCAHPLRCFQCLTPDRLNQRDCWEIAALREGDAYLPALIRVGHPYHQTGLDRGRRRLRLRLEGAADNDAEAMGDGPTSLGAQLRRSLPRLDSDCIRHRLSLLETVTPGEFWAVVMRSTGMTGVAASLVFQALIPDFRIRIV